MADARGQRVVVGVGNPDRGDDGAGRAVVRALAGHLPEDVRLVEQGGEATSLLACLEGAEAAWLVDACMSGAPAGTVHRFDLADGKLPEAAFGVSTHGFGVAAATELGRALGQLPRRCFVYAIEADSFAAGAPLSPPVAAAVATVARRLRDELCAEARP